MELLGLFAAFIMPILLALLIYRIVNHKPFGWVVFGMALASSAMWQSLIHAIFICGNKRRI